MELQDLLQYASEHGIIDLANIRAEAEMTRREEIIAAHPHKIWQGKDGKWRTYVYAEGYPKNLKLVCKTTLAAVEDTIVKEFDDKQTFHTFREVFKQWNDRRLNNNLICPGTYALYLEALDRFYGDSGLDEKDLAKITISEWQMFLEDWANKVHRPQYGNLITITRGTLFFAKKLGYITYSVNDIFETLDISEKQFKKTEKEERDEVYTEEEFLKLKAYFITHPTLYNLGVLLIFVIGVRIGELVALLPTDISDDYIIHIHKTMSVKLEDGKYKKYIKDSPKSKASIRDVPVPEEYHWVVDKLKEMTRGDRYIFANSCNNVDTRYFSVILKRACRATGVKYKSLHKIRKTYCTMLYDNDVNPKTIAKLVGHSGPRMTLNIYNKDVSTLDDRREMVNTVFK